MSDVIPDPEKPQRWAVNAATGELLSGVQFTRHILNVPAPTLRELENGGTVWFKDGSVTFGVAEPVVWDTFDFQIPTAEDGAE